MASLVTPFGGTTCSSMLKTRGTHCCKPQLCKQVQVQRHAFRATHLCKPDARFSHQAKQKFATIVRQAASSEPLADNTLKQDPPPSAAAASQSHSSQATSAMELEEPLLAKLSTLDAQGFAAMVAAGAPAYAKMSQHFQSHLHLLATDKFKGCSAAQLSQLLWALSELDCPLPDGYAAQVQQAVQERLEDFFAPELATTLCALGDMDAEFNPEFLQKLKAEAQYQLAEFLTDFTATDLARLISGLADMGITLDGEFGDVVMKAVYTVTKTIEDKASVDFALTKIAAEKKSMHYDSRWTHEELNWLPRRERDKRRIIKENWYRTKWTGFNAASDRR